MAASRAIAKPANALDAVRVVVLLGLLALAGYLAVKLVIGVVSPESRYEPVRLAAPVQAVATGPQSYDWSNNPFAAGDEVADAPVETAPSTENAPETTLNLKLTGQRTGPNGSAFIQTPDSQADNYYVGDLIMPNVYLRAVMPNHVVIDVNGQAQRLTSEDAKEQAQRTQAPSRGTTARSLSTLKGVDVRNLMSQVSLTPKQDSAGRFIGVTLTPRSSNMDLSAFGLKSGDVLTSIGGVPLSNGMPDPVALGRAASSGRPVEVSFLRDGSPMSVTIG